MQITISDELVQQTMQVFHTNNAQIALEKALQSFLYSKNKNIDEIRTTTKKENSIASAFEELKILCQDEDYELDLPVRSNRSNPFTDL